MRKPLFFAVIFGSLFLLFVSVGAKKANAQILGDTALISGYLDNTAGTIPITVTISFYSGSSGSPFLLPEPNPKVYVVPVGQRVSASYGDYTDRGWYQIRWGTSCTDPPVQAINAVVPGAYIFPSQDVHCTTPNATPSITNTSCANFGWNLTGVGPNGSNISSFEVFKSTNYSQVGPGDPTIGPAATLGVSARSYDFGNQASGTYYVRVRAVSPQGIGSWSSVDQFTCAPAGQAPTAASNLNATRSCNGSGAGNIVNVDFTWNRSTPMPSDEQWIDYSVYNNSFGGGYANASLSTSASSYNGTGFAQGIKYYWRINNRYGSNWYPSATGSFLTPTCPVGATPRPTSTPVVAVPGVINATGVADCAAGGVTLSWSVVTVPIPPLKNQYIEMRLTNGTVVGFAPIPIMNNQPRTYTVPWNYWAARGFPGYNLLGSTNVWYVVGTYDEPVAPNYRTGIPFYSNGMTITNPASCAPAVTYTITASGNSDCIDGINPKVHLTWNSNTDNTTYTIYKDGVAQSPTVSGAGRSWDSGPETAGQSHSWVVRGTGGVAGTVSSNAVAITTATCSSPPLNASGLTIAVSCNGTNPEVEFTWADNATNETGYWLDVSHDAFSGPTTTIDPITGMTKTPSVWGVKTLGANVTSWLWSSNTVAGVSGPMGEGNANPQTATDTDDLKPLKSTQYYWRVRAFSADRQSDHVYPPFGTVPPGTPFETLSCTKNYDLSARIIPNSWNKQNFDVGETATLKVEITNLATTSTDTSVPSTFYFFPDGDPALLPVCKLRADGTLDPTSRPVLTPPQDADTPPKNLAFSVPALAVGATSLPIDVSFTVSKTPTHKTGYAYVVPSCSFSPDLGIDPNFTNNQSDIGFGYTVGVKGFFETQGGDVGAAATSIPNIRVAFDSSTIPAPGQKYQSDYLIAGNIDPKVHSRPSGWMLNNYDKRQVSSAGVYDFFANKFKAQAVDNGCSFSHADAIQSCSGNLTFNPNPADAALSGNKVFFVERNLKIMKNLVLGANDSIVFIVKGDIIVDTIVTQIDGVYISKHSFIDHDTADPALAIVTQALTVNGAVYVDTLPDDHGTPGLIDLKRYFSGPLNGLYAPVRVKYDPKYLISMREIIGVKSIIWKEVAP